MVSSLWMDHVLIVSLILGVRVLQGELRTQRRKSWSQWECGKLFNENMKKIFRKHAHPQSLSRVCLCNPMDYNPPGSTVHGILQARILEWAALTSSRGTSGPRNQTHISYNSLLHWQVGSLPLMPPEQPHIYRSLSEFKGFPGGSDSRESSCNARNVGSIPGSGRSLGEGNAYWATVHDVAKSWTQLRD